MSYSVCISFNSVIFSRTASMGHGEVPFKIPHYTIYSNYRQFPQLLEHEERLKRIGLKDPWIRNYVHLFDKNHPHIIGFFPHLRSIVMAGWKFGAISATVLIAIEEGYSYMKYGKTSWDAHH
ncbi:unnamed protein product [Dracunculus medinensis]|uniref:NADH dehydrogenase [ubiquinone] 1 beta subcomplex subunit 3 n=1 Tax=Dracunculus medinensis TaxID=318479 RepID=A0A0N4UMP2_DRAME|nr:unnamed protein product [Dracunculus medinensis]